MSSHSCQGHLQVRSLSLTQQGAVAPFVLGFDLSPKEACFRPVPLIEAEG